MSNILDFRMGRTRARASTEMGQEGARILFFTGVRYVRDMAGEAPPFVPEASEFHDASRHAAPTESEVAFELAGH